MTISLNGDPYTIDGTLTIAALLAKLDVDPRRVAVERNFVIVKRDQYASTAIADGDQIEIVNFVGGGSARSRLRSPLLRLPPKTTGDQEIRRNNRKKNI